MDVYLLERTLEIDLEIGDDAESFRLEILQSRDRPGRFRGRLWRLAMLRSVATFPQDEEGEPTEVLDAEQPTSADELLEQDFTDFGASSVDDAEARMLRDLRERLLAIAWAKR